MARITSAGVVRASFNDRGRVMHQHRDYAAMSDPIKNYQFHRPWVDPPWPPKRKRGPVARAAFESNSNSNSREAPPHSRREVRVMEDLFGWEEPPRYPASPAPGKTDTSAAVAAKSDRKTIRARVLASLTGDGPATSTELSERLDIIFEDVQPRTSELRARGLIEDSGESTETRASFGPWLNVGAVFNE